VLPALVISGDVVSITPALAAWGLAIALLSDVLAYTLQASALTRLSGAAFSLLVSTEPAVGAILGLILLGQPIALVQWLGIALVTVVAAGATASRPDAPGGERASGLGTSLAGGLPRRQRSRNRRRHKRREGSDGQNLRPGEPG